jgi:hypothetical protein
MNENICESSSEEDSLFSESSSNKCTPLTSDRPRKLQFPWKLHTMLDNAIIEGHDSIVSWDGVDGFKVREKEAFVREIVPRYFSHTKYRSFQRMLNMWGFERVPKGPRKGVYVHINFRQGQPEFCNYMKCQKIKRRHTTSPQLEAQNKDSPLVSCLRRDNKTHEVLNLHNEKPPTNRLLRHDIFELENNDVDLHNESPSNDLLVGEDLVNVFD